MLDYIELCAWNKHKSHSVQLHFNHLVNCIQLQKNKKITDDQNII